MISASGDKKVERACTPPSMEFVLRIYGALEIFFFLVVVGDIGHTDEDDT